MKLYEKVINVIAGIGFLALVPVGLAVFHIYGPLDFLSEKLGFWGSATFLMVVFYGLTIIRILFGHAELYAPLVIGVLASFLLMCLAVPVSFMAWYRGLAGGIPFLADAPLAFIVALAVMGLGTLIASAKKFPLIAELLLLVVLPVGVVQTVTGDSPDEMPVALDLPRSTCVPDRAATVPHAREMARCPPGATCLPDAIAR